MAARTIARDVFSVGAIDFDRRLFDELIPLPEGTSYNAYLIKGSEKTVLIDTVDPTKEFELIENLVKLGIETLDYVVINHAEQDHAGSLPMILEFFPMAKVVTNEKCRDLLIAFLHVLPDVFHIVKDGDTLPLGDRTLQFYLTPWTHWPETQVT
ncbi:FprA family A-type flavoprotein, partial [Methanoregula sp.]|uniref:FprA family A-type flavoprotein n=1 Tax=Methanoregula sp. TaxID=2052170 RepID=UPI000CA6979C